MFFNSIFILNGRFMNSCKEFRTPWHTSTELVIKGIWLFFSSSSFSFFFFVFIIYGIPLGIFKTCFAIFGYPPVAYLIHMSPNTHLIWKSGYFFFYGFHRNTKFSVKGFTQQNEIKEKNCSWFLKIDLRLFQFAVPPGLSVSDVEENHTLHRWGCSGSNITSN